MTDQERASSDKDGSASHLQMTVTVEDALEALGMLLLRCLRRVWRSGAHGQIFEVSIVPPVDKQYTGKLSFSVSWIAGHGRFQYGMIVYAGLAWLADAAEMILLSFIGPAVCHMAPYVRFSEMQLRTELQIFVFSCC